MAATLDLHLHATALYLQLKDSAGYRAGLRAAVRAFWGGTFDYFQFIDAMLTAIDFHFPRAWGEGMRAVGLQFPQDATLDEINALNRLIVNERGHVDSFAQAIEDGSKNNGGKLTPLLDRVEKWVVRYNAIVSQAMQMARNDPKLMWLRNASDSCASCIRLDGQVRRASTWAQYNLRPQSMLLQCMKSAKGVPVCRCQFQPTDAPMTRGRLPSI